MKRCKLVAILSDTAQVDTAQVDTTQVDTTQVEPAPRTDTVNIDETNIDETLGEQTVKMGRTLSLVPVESVTVEVEPIAPKTIESQEKQAISQLVPTATFVPTSTPVSTPSPTQVPAQVLPAPTLAPTQAPIVQVIAQSASPTIIIQQAAMRSSSSSSFAQNGSIRLLNPIDGINGRKRQTFEWSADFVPGPNQGFELIFWKPGQDPWDSGFGLAAPTTESSITVNLDELDETLGTMLDWGQYRWGVLLVEREPYRRIVLLGTNGTPESRAFLFTNYKSAEHQVEHQSASAQGSP